MMKRVKASMLSVVFLLLLVFPAHSGKMAKAELFDPTHYGYTAAQALKVNEIGDVVGLLYQEGEYSTNALFYIASDSVGLDTPEVHVILLDNGSSYVVNPYYNYSIYLSEDGKVFGTPTYGVVEAFVWSAEDGLEYLPTGIDNSFFGVINVSPSGVALGSVLTRNHRTKTPEMYGAIWDKDNGIRIVYGGVKGLVDINSSGKILGYTWAQYRNRPFPRAIVMDSADSYPAVVPYPEARYVANYSTAYGINDSGDIVVGFHLSRLGKTMEHRVLIKTDGQFEFIPMQRITGPNEAGQVAGTYNAYYDYLIPTGQPIPERDGAALWTPDSGIEVGVNNKQNSTYGLEVIDLNDFGEFVGFHRGKKGNATMWSPALGKIRLGGGQSRAFDINNSGWVVGACPDGITPCLWTP